MTQFDSIFLYLGDCGRFQIWHYFLLCLLIIPVAQQIYLNTFLFATPLHRCRLASILSDDSYYFNDSTPAGHWIQKLIPKKNNTLDSCHFLNHTGIFENGTGNISIPRNASKLNCDDGWLIDKTYYEKDVVTFLNLYCDKAEWATYANSLVFVGVLIGSFLFGFVSDRFGRHLALMISIVGLLLSGVSVAYMKTYLGIVTMRIISCAFSQGIFMSAFIISVEMMGPSARMVAGIVIEFFFAGGVMLLAVMAYYIRSWVWLQLCSSVPISFFLLYYFAIPESPRWLLSKTKFGKFRKIIQRAAQMNGKTIPEDVMEELQDSALEIQNSSGSNSCLDLFRFPNIAFKAVNLFFCWLVVTMVYYGITMNMTALPGSPYLKVVISGAVEIPAYCACLLFLNWWGRRILLTSSMILGGVFFIICFFFQRERDMIIITSLALTGKFFISAAFAVVYIFTAELFPTCIRTLGVGLCSLFARFGGILAPIIIQSAEDHHKPRLVLIVFGVLSLVSGVFTFVLPETLNKVLPETLEQAEAFGKFRFCSKKRHDNEDPLLDSETIRNDYSTANPINNDDMPSPRRRRFGRDESSNESRSRSNSRDESVSLLLNPEGDLDNSEIC